MSDVAVISDMNDSFDTVVVSSKMETKRLMEKSQRLRSHWKNRENYLRDIRKPFEAFWDAVDLFVQPVSFVVNDRNDQTNSGSVNNRIFNGAVVNASNISANSFASSVAPQGIQFFNSIPDIESEEFNFQEEAEIDRYCKYHEKVLSQGLRDSTFFKSLITFAKKGLDYGTTAMYEIEKPDGTLTYEVLAKSTYFIDNGFDGEVDTLWRVIWMQNRHIVSEFSNIDQTLRDKLKESPYRKTRVLHIVEPRSDFDPDSKISIKKRFASYYVIPSQDWYLLEESGFDEFPYIVWRQYKEPGVVWGLGSGIMAIRDAQILQSVSKTNLDAKHRAVDPPWAVPSDKEGEEELWPGGRMYLEEGQEKLLFPIQSPVAMNWGDEAERKLEDAINKHYHVDYWLMLNNLEAKDRTAMEIAELQNERSTVTASLLAGFASEVLDRVLAWMTKFLLKTKKLRPFQPETTTFTQSEMKLGFNYTSPLTMAQTAFTKIAGAQKSLQQILPMSEALPSILDNIDEDQVALLFAQSNNSIGILRDPKQRDQIRKDRAQAQAAQMQAEFALKQAQVQAEVQSKAGTVPEQGSLAEQQMGGGQ